MKYLLSFLSFISFTIFANSAMSEEAVSSEKNVSGDAIIKKLSQQDVQGWQAPRIDKIQIGAGPQLIFKKNTTLPIVHLKIFLPIGSYLEPSDKIGLAAITASNMRIGGAGEWKPDLLNTRLESLGASISVSVNDEYTVFSLAVLSRELDPALDILFAILQKPRFNEKRLQRSLQQSLEALRRQFDTPRKIASYYFPKLIYGEDTLQGRSTNPEIIRSIKRQELVDFHKKYFDLKKATIAISGDFDSAKLFAKIMKFNKVFKAEQTDLGKKLQSLALAKKQFKAGKFFIHKKTDQALILVGHLGAKRTNPAKFSLILFNHLLGGSSLTSRLGVEIRSNRGLVYAVYSQFGFSFDYGVFKVTAQTKASTALEVISLIEKNIIESLKPKATSQKQLDEAKASFLNSLYQSYDPVANIVDEEARFSFLRYPENYLSIFAEKIKAVQLSEMQKEANEYILPQELTYLVIGDRDKLSSLLESKEWKEIKIKK